MAPVICPPPRLASRTIGTGVVSLIAGVLVTACESGAIPDGLGSQFRDEWRTEIVTVFPDDVRTIYIGGREHDYNFANRGDVIVRYAGPPGEIRVELRRFDGAASEQFAADHYSWLHLWAYATDAPPAPPDSVVGTDCTEGWVDGCRVRVWYDGPLEPSDMGADIRITLPVDYRHDTLVETTDGDDEEFYPDPSNVCLQGLNGTAQVRLGSGLLWTKLAPSATHAPSCSVEDFTACKEFTKVVDGQEVDAAWDPDCPCRARGSLSIETDDGQASNVTMEVGTRLWATVDLQTDAPCEASVDVEGFVADDPESSEDLSGEMNRPSDYATDGGFKLTARSSECGEVSFIHEFSFHQGPGTETRGNLVVCEDCLDGLDCEALMATLL